MFIAIKKLKECCDRIEGGLNRDGIVPWSSVMDSQRLVGEIIYHAGHVNACVLACGGSGVNLNGVKESLINRSMSPRKGDTCRAGTNSITVTRVLGATIWFQSKVDGSPWNMFIHNKNEWRKQMAESWKHPLFTYTPIETAS